MNTNVCVDFALSVTSDSFFISKDALVVISRPVASNSAVLYLLINHQRDKIWIVFVNSL